MRQLVSALVTLGALLLLSVLCQPAEPIDPPEPAITVHARPHREIARK